MRNNVDMTSHIIAILLGHKMTCQLKISNDSARILGYENE